MQTNPFPRLGTSVSRLGERLRAFVPQHAASLVALALQFVLYHTGVTTALVSMHVKRFAEDNLRAWASPPLSAATFEELRRHHRWIRNFYGPKVL